MLKDERSPGGLLEAREQTIDRLSEAFARDEIDLEQYEHRVDLAFSCRTREELVRVLGALTPHEGIVPLSPPSAEVVRVKRSALLPRVALAVFAKVKRGGLSALSSRSKMIAVFGSIELDLRDAVLDRGLTELKVRAVFGNVELTVPPNLAVQCEGVGIFGRFETMARLPADPTAEPVLRITGAAVFGNVELHTGTSHPRSLPGSFGPSPVAKGQQEPGKAAVVRSGPRCLFGTRPRRR